jgi:hypothetical protein
MKSKILEYIKNNPDNWEQKLNEMAIRTNHNGDLVCFKYDIQADFSDPLVCEARGIIMPGLDLRRSGTIKMPLILLRCWCHTMLKNSSESILKILLFMYNILEDVVWYAR